MVSCDGQLRIALWLILLYMYRVAVLNSHPIQYFAPLYRRLAQEPDIDLTVYFCSRQGAEEYFDPGFGQRLKWDTSLLEGYKYKFLKNVRRQDQVAGFWSLINFEVVRELRTNKYDALWVNGHNFATYLIGIGAARWLKIPVLMRCETHLLLQRSRLKRAIRKPLMRYFYNRLCDVCLPIGTRNREFYLAHGVDNARMFTVPYAVDNAYFTEATSAFKNRSETKNELGLPLRLPLVLSVSKMLLGKKLMDLLVAFHRIRKSGVEAALVFVGSGEQEMKLRDYVREHELPDVYFFGFRNQSELPRFYAVADIFVFPSASETWGLSLNEAMCAGLPVIASRDIGAVPDLVRQGENGFAFESGNEDELVDYMRRLLGSSERRKLMGVQSRKIISHWDYERCVLGVRTALESVSRQHSWSAESEPA